ncbi:PAS domain S-box-containing protein [Thermomonospora echinospora]|uniref:protein-serine/threonine phosphatase n=1 Tax=Thermomonospora echinospora TaxID=1992 RepID=A0A1H6E4N4_9ACTN|nr:SpoIIE family protein phosphatase [Thermomonospora echinospora]SEG91974.1 PAS domain S-box-containing protein [Thermomonospora echinospora]
MDATRGEGTGRLALEAFDSVPVAIALTIGQDHRLAYTNVAYRAYFGDRSLGELISEVFGDLSQRDHLGLLDHVLATGERSTLTEAPVTLSFSDTGDEERFFSFSLSRVAPEPSGVLIMAVDVTGQVAAARRAAHTAEQQRRILRRYQSLVQVTAQIVWVTGSAGEPIEPSPGWERVTGQSWEEVRGTGWTRALHPDDREPAIRSWAEARRQHRPWRHVYRVRTKDGEYRHFETNSAPVYENDVVVEWVGTYTDVEERWQRRRRRELIDRAATATAEHTELPEMVGAIADVLVPALVDGCGMHLLPGFSDRPEGAPVIARRVATTAREGLPPHPPLREEQFAANSGFTRAVERRRPLYRRFPPGEPPADLLPEESTAWLAEASANSVVLLPVMVDGTVAAVVTAATCGDRPPLSTGDVDLIDQMFKHTHNALSKAVQFQRTQQVALALQHSLLAEPPDHADLRIVARYLPSPAAAEVGGDWYDSFVLPDGATVLAIGDAAGHNLDAAVQMSQLRNILRALTVDRPGRPGEILRRLNIVMESLVPDTTATCALARIEQPQPGRWQLNYAVAGHPPPLLVTPDGDCRLLEDATNPLLGVVFDQPYDSAVEHLPPCSTVLLYTDGLIERPGENLDQGLERLREQASALARRPLEGFCDGLLNSLLATTGTDDIALIALRAPTGSKPGP